MKKERDQRKEGKKDGRKQENNEAEKIVLKG